MCVYVLAAGTIRCPLYSPLYMERISNFLRGSKQSAEEPALPARFAEEVLDLELEVEASPQVDIEVVNRLIELYSIAVEYYESVKSNKYVVFKNKITKLLLNPSINRTMESNTKEGLIFGEEPSQKMLNELRKKQLENTLTFATQNTEGDVRSLMICANDRFDNVAKMINSGILVQEYEIRERLKRRKKQKPEAFSRDSTETDPKELKDEQENDLKEPEPAADKKQPSNNSELDTAAETTDQAQEKENEEKADRAPTQPSRQQQPVASPLKEPETAPWRKEESQKSKNIEKATMTPEQVFLMKLQKIQKKKKKKVLVLKGDQKPDKLPEQYNIPF